MINCTDELHKLQMPSKKITGLSEVLCIQQSYEFDFEL